jgi:plastocyanin
VARLAPSNEAPGEIAYTCRLHPVMHGVLIVK